MLLPELTDYNIKTLEILGNKTNDEFCRSSYRMAIIQKLLKKGYKMFYLINKFISVEGIMKESLADTILINMQGNDYLIDSVITDEILRYSSLDMLMYYGADSKLYEFNKKCKDEFYRRGEVFEDKIELQRKKKIDRKIN